MMEMCLHILYTFWHIAASELAFWHSVWPCNTVSLYHCCKKWQSLLIHWLNPLIPTNLVNQTFLHRAILLLSWAPDGSLCSQDLFVMHLLLHASPHWSAHSLPTHFFTVAVLCKTTQLSHMCMQWKSRSPLYEHAYSTEIPLQLNKCLFTK